MVFGSLEHKVWFLARKPQKDLYRAAIGAPKDLKQRCAQLAVARVTVAMDQDAQHLDAGYPESWRSWKSALPVTHFLSELADISFGVLKRCDRTDYPRIVTCSACSTTALAIGRNLDHPGCPSSALVKSRVLFPGEVPAFLLGSGHPPPDMTILACSPVLDFLRLDDVILTGFAASLSEAQSKLASSDEKIWWCRADESNPILPAWKRTQALDFLLRATAKPGIYSEYRTDTLTMADTKKPSQFQQIVEFYSDVRSEAHVVRPAACTQCNFTAPWCVPRTKGSSLKHANHHPIHIDKKKVFPFADLPINFQRVINLGCFFNSTARDSNRISVALQHKIK